MSVAELIAHLQTFPPDLPVMAEHYVPDDIPEVYDLHPDDINVETQQEWSGDYKTQRAFQALVIRP